MKRSDIHRRRISEALKGHTVSMDTREKIRQSHLGRKVPREVVQRGLETRVRNGNVLAGNKHPNWKGGKTWERFKDPNYISWRAAVLERDNYTCQHCRRTCRKHEKGLAAHHILSYAAYPDLRAVGQFQNRRGLQS